ncbi:fumarate reductase flavoprotein subunit [Thraustotheca clavata]|uniref:fumarate reductase (NADH) n=1 Tax=Thraustotheca clavata TaxID=74557 RepID=A0A1W0A920_9STRA|nr:fumarate reductase flavoprotein subunit [Thraustotheca clavata]
MHPHFKSFLFVLAVQVSMVAYFFSQESTELPAYPTSADIVIVGAGLAGMSAALEAITLRPETHVILIEKEDRLGGNSAKASSGINAAKDQEDVPLYTEDTVRSGGGFSIQSLVDRLTTESLDGLEFLRDKGVDLSVLCQLGGHSAERTRRNKSGPNVGTHIILALKKAIEESETIDVINHAHVTSIEKDDDNKVTGLTFSVTPEATFSIVTTKVILATGGYSANPELLKKYAPGMEEFATTNGAWATGDGLQLATDLGAALIHTDKVQLHPTGFIDPKDRTKRQRFLAPEALRGAGGLLFNTDGHRFVNELATRKVVSEAILEQPNKRSFLILPITEAVTQATGALGLFFYQKIGLVSHITSLQDLAEHMQVDQAILQAEFEQYVQAASGATPDAFGKTVFPNAPSEVPTDVYLLEIEPVVHYTMGGVKIDENAQALTQDDQVIEGLFAAGEVSGGLHGQNRLGGNSLAECVVFGRIAAQAAIKSL